MESFKKVEQERYDQRAIRENGSSFDHKELAAYHQAPYELYHKLLREALKPNFRVLELACGMGEHTTTLVDGSKTVVALDISQRSLDITKKKFQKSEKLKVTLADLESLPFADKSFDLVACAGSLSYGKNELIMGNVNRVLKDNGIFLCVDILGDNPIYNLNRLFHALRGNRSLSICQNAPKLDCLKKNLFGFELNFFFFGSLMFLAPLFKTFFGETKTQRIIDLADKFFKTRRSAFKFVLIAKKKKSTQSSSGCA